MKKLILSLLLAFPIFANAYDAVVDGIYYNLNSEEKVAEVTKAKDGYRGNVNIPPTITYNGVKYTVNSIGNEAFILCGDLTSVTIPNTVTNIGERVFLHYSMILRMQTIDKFYL